MEILEKEDHRNVTAERFDRLGELAHRAALRHPVRAALQLLEPPGMNEDRHLHEPGRRVLIE
jgi:hypothetical protein